MQEEISLANAEPVGEVEDPSEIMALVIQEVKRCLHVPNDSLSNICRQMEEATSEGYDQADIPPFQLGDPDFSEADSSGQVRRAFCKGAQ